MKTYIRIFAVVVFVSGAAVFAITHAKHSGSQKLQPFVATYVTTLETQDSRNGRSELAVRLATGDGRWREVQWSDRGRSVQLADDNGVYEAERDGRALQYVGPSSDDVVDASDLAKVTRTETVAGITAYVFRTDNPDGYIEYYFAPQMGRHHIKAVIFKGPHYKYTREAVSVQFRPVSDEEVAVPNLPIKFDNVDKQVDAMKKSGALSPVFEQAVQSAKQRATREPR